jgi:hypothetical protein
VAVISGIGVLAYALNQGSAPALAAVSSIPFQNHQILNQISYPQSSQLIRNV